MRTVDQYRIRPSVIIYHAGKMLNVGKLMFISKTCFERKLFKKILELFLGFL